MVGDRSKKPKGRDPNAVGARTQRRQQAKKANGTRAQEKNTSSKRKPEQARSFHSDLLPIALSGAVQLRIMQLEALPDEEFAQTWCRWRDEAEQNRAFTSEAVLFRTARKGETAEAFNVLAKVIAVLSFAPGGVECFNSTYIGRRQSPGWAAMNTGPEAGEEACSVEDARSKLDVVQRPQSRIDLDAA